MSEPELLNTRQAAEYLATTPDGISQLVREGKLTAYRIGGTYLRFKRDEVLHFRDVTVRDVYLKERRLREEAPPKIRPQTPPPDPKAPKPAPAAPTETAPEPSETDWRERLKEFWYFNDFYVYSAGVAGVMLYFIFR